MKFCHILRSREKANKENFNITSNQCWLFEMDLGIDFSYWFRNKFFDSIPLFGVKIELNSRNREHLLESLLSAALCLRVYSGFRLCNIPVSYTSGWQNIWFSLVIQCLFSLATVLRQLTKSVRMFHCFLSPRFVHLLFYKRKMNNYRRCVCSGYTTHDMIPLNLLLIALPSFLWIHFNSNDADAALMLAMSSTKLSIHSSSSFRRLTLLIGSL